MPTAEQILETMSEKEEAVLHAAAATEVVIPPLPVAVEAQQQLLNVNVDSAKPSEVVEEVAETYIYRDFANADAGQLETGSTISHAKLPPSALASQKLPSKLGAMLSDPDLAAVITWMPHGRAWKILNRDLFAQFALPRYFGHQNHASFVRIVNAWGFRRISSGVDRDAYYHELFLRGKPRLHERMKRVPSCHKKTPIDKDAKIPDFYELAKTSLLPEVSWGHGSNPVLQAPAAGAAPGGGAPTMGSHPAFGQMPGAPGQFVPFDTTGVPTMNGLVGGGMLHANPNFNNPMMSLLNQGGNAMPAAEAAAAAGSPARSATAQQLPPQNLNEYTRALQQENENLLLKIRILEYENAQRMKREAEQANNVHEGDANVPVEESKVEGGGVKEEDVPSQV